MNKAVKIYMVGISTTLLRLIFYSILVGSLLYLYESVALEKLTPFFHHVEHSFSIGASLEAWLSFWRAIISEATEDVAEGITVDTIVKRVLS